MVRNHLSSPFIRAIVVQNFERARLLVEHGAISNTRSPGAVHMAESEGGEKIISLLSEH